MTEELTDAQKAWRYHAGWTIIRHEKDPRYHGSIVSYNVPMTEDMEQLLDGWLKEQAWGKDV